MALLSVVPKGKSEVAAAPSAWVQTVLKPHRISLTCTSFFHPGIVLDYRVGRVSCRGCAVLVWLGLMAGNGLVSGFVLKSHCEVCLVLKHRTDADLRGFFPRNWECFDYLRMPICQSASLIFVNFSEARVTNHLFLQQELWFSVFLPY